MQTDYIMVLVSFMLAHEQQWVVMIIGFHTPKISILSSLV